ncbi:MAG TPA: GTPase ObgE [Candidatus Omnitrophota bacterium]|jgi:GTP-binding protein|nr:GTPase ObgE [Candidatus Omnitrophota bacterium]
MAFIDEARIFIKAGDGGKGCESFYRNKYFRYPRPNGGDGGKGGDVVFVADPRIQTLLDFKFKQHYKAERGGHGGSKGKTGHRGADCVLRVPVGTILSDAESGLIFRDLTEADQQVIVAKGGAGGQGNQNNRTPTQFELGEEKTVHLQLKLIADVGLVGCPNAGKSTFINQVSKVRSKIASYPFTTKQPILGVVEGEDVQFVIADLPGLIEGAHQGRGLGDRFLKHAERTKVLVHLVDMAAADERDPLEDFAQISEELKEYNEALTVKERIIVANKMDLPKAAENLKRFQERFKLDVFEVSALTGEGVEAVVKEIRRILKSSKTG